MDYRSVDFFGTGNIIAGYTTGGEGHWHDHTKEDWPHFEELAESFGLKISDLIRTRQRHTDAIWDRIFVRSIMRYKKRIWTVFMRIFPRLNVKRS